MSSYCYCKSDKGMNIGKSGTEDISILGEWMLECRLMSA